MTKLIETPYDDDVRELARDFGLSLDQARDRFILSSLQMGEAGLRLCAGTRSPPAHSTYDHG